MKRENIRRRRVKSGGGGGLFEKEQDKYPQE
jgi:hypothetical protein